VDFLHQFSQNPVSKKDKAAVWAAGGNSLPAARASARRSGISGNPPVHEKMRRI
jgi:hypothetical protein